MFNAPKASTQWFPYKIPPMPNDLWEGGKQYVLGLSNKKPIGEKKLPSEKNPSPFLIWTEGGGGPPCALGLYNKNGSVYISSGTIAGQLPPNFDPVEGKFIAGSGSGSVYAEININGDTGEIDSVDVKKGTGSNTDTKFVIAIGAYEYNQNNQPQITNFRCGPINISLCRNWFVAQPPYFTANIS